MLNCVIQPLDSAILPCPFSITTTTSIAASYSSTSIAATRSSASSITVVRIWISFLLIGYRKKRKVWHTNLDILVLSVTGKGKMQAYTIRFLAATLMLLHLVLSNQGATYLGQIFRISAKSVVLGGYCICFFQQGVMWEYEFFA